MNAPVLPAWRVPAFALLVAMTLACGDDGVSRAVAPKTANPDNGLPRLSPGGASFVVSPGTSVPSVPAQWTSGFASVRNANALMGVAALALAPRSPAPHSEHILLENTTTGARALWVISIGSIVNSASLGTMDLAWHITGAGDFNADGFEDILWENTNDGSRAVWLMNGVGGVLATIPFGIVPLEWHMAGAGDYNTDGKDDILWENNITGARVIWVMNGGTVISTLTLGTLSPDWLMHGVNDFNSDGKDDILLGNKTTGVRAIWIMNGNLGVAGSVTLGTMPLEWRTVDGGDIDGDYHQDIILENATTGLRAAWLENGFAKVVSAPILTSLSPDWQMKAVLTSDLGDRSGSWISLGQSGHNIESNCAIRTGGVGYCWGYNYNSVLGLNHGDLITTATPLPISTRLRFSDISAGEFIACGIDLNGIAYCWGNTTTGLGATGSPIFSMLGNSALGGATAPVQVAMPGGVSFTQISTFYDHTCALSSAATIYCWGRNTYGQLGVGDQIPRGVPNQVSGTVHYASVSSGYQQTCGKSTVGQVYCWGVADQARPFSLVPAFVPLPAAVTQVSIGYNHACALGGTGNIYCWGNNSYGQLGVPTSTPATTPQTVLPPTGSAFASVAAGYLSTCALTTAGGAYCWGANAYAEFGNGTAGLGGPIPRAVVVPLGVQFTELMLGGGGSICAISTTAALYCWGYDGHHNAAGGAAVWNGSNIQLPALAAQPKVIAAQ